LKRPAIVIITGCSGSGKSTALNAFEDAGFFCVDNMPIALLPDFLAKFSPRLDNAAGLAFVMDLRDDDFLSSYSGVISELRQEGWLIKLVFLEAKDSVLLRRYSHTRRHHPLGKAASLLKAIQTEKRLIENIRGQADHLIDTSDYSVHELKFATIHIAQNYASVKAMAVNVLSFGYKYGIPRDADLIMDVRFLANPYFVADLKPLDGECPPVRQFVLQHPETEFFLRKYIDLIDYLIPLYEKEGKAYLNLAVGCTGGRHRSVVIARMLYEHISSTRSSVSLIHRDIN